MEFKALKCPNCGAKINSSEDELDIFYCSYCGYKIILDGQSAAAYSAKLEIKKMQHEEKMQDNVYEQEMHKLSEKEKIQDKVFEQEKYRLAEEEKNNRVTWIAIFIPLLVSILLVAFVSIDSKQETVTLEQELQQTVEEIMIDIENESFDSAYIKANSLYWNSIYGSDSKEKWNSTREAIVDKIEEAEKEVADIGNKVESDAAEKDGYTEKADDTENDGIMDFIELIKDKFIK